MLDGNESLMFGGFLARCLAFDGEAEYKELRGNEPEISSKRAMEFYRRIEKLFGNYLLDHDDDIGYQIVKPTAEAKKIMLDYRNKCGRLENGALHDIRPFPARWTEN